MESDKSTMRTDNKGICKHSRPLRERIFIFSPCWCYHQHISKAVLINKFLLVITPTMAIKKGG